MNLSIEIIFLIKRSIYNCRYINKCVCGCACIYIRAHTHTQTPFSNRQKHPDSLLTNRNMSSIKVHLKKHGLVLKSLHSQVMKLHVKTPWEII